MFKPNYQITSLVAKALMRIEAAKQAVMDLPITTTVLSSLRETARLYSTHYSTQIEGNRLTLKQAERVIHKEEHFPGRERDEKEVLGYYRALDEIERLSKSKKITQTHLKTIHALVMSSGKSKVKPTPYREGQNVIKDSRTGRIVYMPPEAKDVPVLMRDLVDWIAKTEKEIPAPLRSAIIHYQLATIHPYYDGNGRLARLSVTLLLNMSGYGLKGLYSLEEYYARNLSAYYKAISLGPSHNYYEGRKDTDISSWIEYFCIGMAEAFENVQKHAKSAANRGEEDQTDLLRRLDQRQRKALSLFKNTDFITASDVGKLFGLMERTSRLLCSKWVQQGFLIVSNPAKKNRKYELNSDLKKRLR